MKLKELNGKIEERRKQLSEIFVEAGEDRDFSKVKSLEGDTTAKVEKVREINDELDSLMKEAEPLREQEAEILRAKRQAEKLGEEFALIRKGNRLSVLPVTAAQWKIILSLE